MNIKIIISLASALLLTACPENQTTPDLTPFEVTIDWVPSPEYYGFFVAKHEKLYERAKLAVKINYGSGAPAVANQIAAGSIYAGTTTSDNLLRQVSRGGEFSSAEPMLRFNPSVVVSLARRPVLTLEGIKDKTIGVNQQSSVYQQFLYLVDQGFITKGAFKEYPIGYGGAAQLRADQVDCILAYATNVMIDLLAEGENLSPPIYFSDNGVKLYGQVLVFGSPQSLAAHNVKQEHVKAFVDATREGFRRGGEDTALAATSLMEAEPTLNRKKIEMAVKKITELNVTHPAKLDELDAWLREPAIDDRARQKARALYH